MNESSKLFHHKISDIKFKGIDFDLISNHELINYKNLSVSKYANQLTLQIHSPVMWSDTIKQINKLGVEGFIEIGPKKTLLNFLPKDYVCDKIAITNNEELLNYV